MTATETLRLPGHPTTTRPAPAEPTKVLEPPPAYDPCDHLDTTRPHDLDTCPSCQGQCLVEVRDWMTGLDVWITCPACAGTGERGTA
ncbi:hypothetical protein [Nocardioides soli]|uniref:Transcription factor zinc-finger domain-containing protein n=1 Tax=Nocardioides soli TaxID=1036020 RepID=A0A7W4YZH6_9ACTN|nr:hypothetical protein [Nocardioides soli]MBB3041179.1 hypothetical protein [Nocardioides soli]